MLSDSPLRIVDLVRNCRSDEQTRWRTDNARVRGYRCAARNTSTHGCPTVSGGRRYAAVERSSAVTQSHSHLSNPRGTRTGSRTLPPASPLVSVRWLPKHATI